jgi:hypothetical protein
MSYYGQPKRISYVQSGNTLNITTSFLIKKKPDCPKFSRVFYFSVRSGSLTCWKFGALVKSGYHICLSRISSWVQIPYAPQFLLLMKHLTMVNTIIFKKMIEIIYSRRLLGEELGCHPCKTDGS